MRTARKFRTGVLLWLAASMVGAAWCAPAPEPGHEIAPTRTAIIPMRDGVGLATDIYLPTADARRLPTILIQTPYGKGNYNREWGLRAGALPHRKIYQVER